MAAVSAKGRSIMASNSPVQMPLRQFKSRGRLTMLSIMLRPQVLLRWLGFQICVDHPYRYLLNFANVMRCSEMLGCPCNSPLPRRLSNIVFHVTCWNKYLPKPRSVDCIVC